MNIDSLVTYYHVIKLKSLTKAAKKLYLSQPGVSYQISVLEKEIGLPLFQYRGKAMHVTEAGNRLFRFAELIYFERINLMRDFEQLRQGLSGELSILASRGAADFILPKLIAEFNMLFPSIGVNIEVLNSSDVIRQTAGAETPCVGFCSLRSNDPELEFIRLLDEDNVVAVSPNHRLAQFDHISFAGLSNETLILGVDANARQRDPIHMMVEAGFDPDSVKSKIVLGSSIGVMTAVESGVGFAFIPSLSVSVLTQQGRIKTLKIDGVDLKRTFYFVYRHESESNPIVATFARYIKNNVIPQLGPSG